MTVSRKWSRWTWCCNGGEESPLIESNRVWCAAAASSALVVVCLRLAPVVLASEAISFQATRSGLAPDGKASSAVADFDGDGDLDVALLGNLPSQGSSSSNLDVLHGDGRGGLDLAHRYLYSSVRAIASADFSGDGIPDLAFTRGGEPICEFLMGDGAGGFAPWLELPAEGQSALAVVAADFDGNGFPDAALACDAGLAAGTLLVFLSDGAGGMTEGESIDAGVGPQSLAVADFDDDGRLDLALGKGAGGVPGYVYLGSGDGGFEPPLPLLVTRRALSVHATDVDLDGDSDLIAVADAQAGQLNAIAVLRGDGSGTLAQTQLVEAMSAGRPLAVADWSEDGYPDVVCWGANGPFSLAHLRNDRTGTLVLSHTDPQLTFGSSAAPPVSADLDGDGHLDLLLPGSGQVIVAIGLGGGRYVAPEASAVGQKPFAADVADFDGDGIPDLAMLSAKNAEDYLSIELGDGSGGFTTSRIESFVRQEDLRSVLARDFDGDGRIDVAVARMIDDAYLEVYPGDGVGRLGEAVQTPLVATAALIHAVADFDEDGRLDVVSDQYAAEREVVLHLGDGAFGFGSIDLMTLPNSHFGSHRSSAADVDLDSHADIVVTEEDGLHVLLGDGAGEFLALPSQASPGFSAIAEIADLTEDGVPDLAVATESGIAVLAGDGLGGFSMHVEIEPDSTALSLAAADLDLDGRLDVLARLEDRRFAGNGISRIGAYSGLGLGAFGPPILYSDGALLVPPVDCDADGRLDQLRFNDFEIEFARNATFDLDDARRGNVNAGAGPVVDVLFLNGSAGIGPERKIVLARGEPITIFMASPPEDPDGPSVFALYKWLVPPSSATLEHLPLGLERSCLSPPLVPFGYPQPKHIWNNAGRQAKLGISTHASVPAPSVVFTLPAGLDRSVTWILQGFIQDRDALNGRGSVTNAIWLEVP